MQKIKMIVVGTIATVGIVTSAGMASAQTVQPGDTLSGIAAANGTTYQHLAQINGISDPNSITVGQDIKVDGGSTPTAKVASPVAAPVAQNNSAKNTIEQRESGGNPNAVNPSSGAVGLFQCLPSAHADCPAVGDAAGQNAWADQYVASRYGSWDAALAFWNANGYY